MIDSELRRSATSLLDAVGPKAVADLAEGLHEGLSASALQSQLGRPDTAEFVRALVAVADRIGRDRATLYVAGLAEGARSGKVDIQGVWTGPITAAPMRSTARALLQVVGSATSELWLSTYSAKPYEPLLEALADADARGVAINIVIETLSGAGSAIGGSEPA